MSPVSWQRWIAVGFVAVPAVALAFAGLSTVLCLRAEGAVDDERAAIVDLTDRVEELGGPVAPAAAGAATRLRAGPEVAGTLREIAAMAEAAGAALGEVRQEPSTIAGKQAFLVKGQGSVASVCALLAAIERNEQLMLVETGRVDADDSEEARFEFAIATYHRLEGGR